MEYQKKNRMMIQILDDINLNKKNRNLDKLRS
jgi:hypothetical protein